MWDGDGGLSGDGDGEASLSGLLPLTEGFGSGLLALAEGRGVDESFGEGDFLPEGLGEAVEDGVGLGESEEDGEGEEDDEGEDDGEGEELADKGTAWHVVVAVVAWGAACAVPRTPRARKLPLSQVTAAALTCAKRIRIACLCCSSGLPCAVRGSEARADRMATFSHIRLPSYIFITSPTVHRLLRGARSAPPALARPPGMGRSPGRIGSVRSVLAIPGRCYPGSFFPCMSFRTVTRP